MLLNDCVSYKYFLKRYKPLFNINIYGIFQSKLSSIIRKTSYLLYLKNTIARTRVITKVLKELKRKLVKSENRKKRY